MLSIRLKQLREEKGLSQAQLARKINIGSDSYNKYERAGVQPAYDVLMSLASEFGVSVDYLIGNSDNPYSNNNFETIDLLKEIERLKAENTALKLENANLKSESATLKVIVNKIKYLANKIEND